MRRNKTKKKTVDSFHAFRRTLSSKRKRVRYIRTRSTCEPIDRGLSSLSRFVARWRNAMMRTTGGGLSALSLSLSPSPSPSTRRDTPIPSLAQQISPREYRFRFLSKLVPPPAIYTHARSPSVYTRLVSLYIDACKHV